MRPPIIESERLTLLPMTSDYIQISWNMMACKPDYYEFYARKPAGYEGYCRMLREDILKMESVQDVVHNYKITNVKGGILGSINIYGYASLSWRVFHVYRSTGVATEAARMLITYMFKNLHREYVQVIVYDEDIASLTIAEKLGFVKFAESYAINSSGVIKKRSHLNLFKKDFTDMPKIHVV